ncbi:MAG: peptidylprolyl isomerase [Oscillospiraceae bacterium]|nr:peptidylprolyl isomerase [Oscillospiraceae bacterium]
MKQKKTLLLILGIVLALAVAVGLFFGVKALSGTTAPTQEQLASNPSSGGEESTAAGESNPTGTGETNPDDSYEMTPEMEAVAARKVYTAEDLTEDDARWTREVASCGSSVLDNHGAQMYYTMSIVNLFSDEQMGAYASMLVDLNTPLSEQDSGAPGLSWEQYFLMDGMQQFQVISALKEKALAEGHSLSESENADLEADLNEIRKGAEEQGYESLDEFLHATFSPGVRYEDYEAYLRSYYLAVSYNEKQYQAIQPTAEELKAYYEANPDYFEGVDAETHDVNVRHILIAPETDAEGNASEEAMAAAKAEAEALLEEYLQNPGEENFAKLAEEHTEDPGSKENGGLYEGVYPGQMVQPFNDWCFDAARKSGDTGIVETAYGYHIMYFVGAEEQFHWEKVAESNLRSETINAQIEALLEEYPLTVRYADIVLAPLPIINQETE